MPLLHFITHPEVVVDPGKPVPRWHLSDKGIARMRILADAPDLQSVARIVASEECKAIEAAGILAGRLGLPVEVHGGLGENDRSATGFLPPAEFEGVADRFFAAPDESVRGWERAVDAQARVVSAISDILDGPVAGDIAVVAHGAVGTLLYCHLAGVAIDRRHDQPFQGSRYAFDTRDRRPLSGWMPIAPK